jgi:hypothetical protein
MKTKLVEYLLQQAQWRDMKASEYPEDHRNAACAHALADAAREIESWPEDDPRLVKLEAYQPWDVFMPDDSATRLISRHGFDKLRFGVLCPPVSAGRWSRSSSRLKRVIATCARSSSKEATIVVDGAERLVRAIGVVERRHEAAVGSEDDVVDETQAFRLLLSGLDLDDEALLLQAELHFRGALLGLVEPDEVPTFSTTTMRAWVEGFLVGDGVRAGSGQVRADAGGRPMIVCQKAVLLQPSGGGRRAQLGGPPDRAAAWIKRGRILTSSVSFRVDPVG